MKITYLPTNKNKQAINPQPKAESGFGLLETIISAVILAILVATSVTITNKYQLISYRSSLRQAISQTVDDDLTEIKLELESYLYQKKHNHRVHAMQQTEVANNRQLALANANTLHNEQLQLHR